MKRCFASIIVLALLLSGCNHNNDIDKAMSLRNKLLNGNGCSFAASVTADYGDNLFSFTMDCLVDKDGNVTFEIKSPETIAGIAGQVTADEGKLIFDEQVLLFDLLTDGFVTPISAPWLLVRTLNGGYINAGGEAGDLYLYQIDDSYEENPLRLDVWLNQDCMPVNADIIWNGRRVVSLIVDDFCIL